jgi:hypothetical protein
MRKIFYTGLIGLAVFEILKVYFIMPFPGSQTMNSLDIAYFLHVYRWPLRILFLVLTLVGLPQALQIKRKWLPVLILILAAVVAYYFNFEMTADSIFKEPAKVTFKNKSGNILGDSSVVVGVSLNGQTKAYPIQYIIYHHQVKDTVGGKPLLITYCSVCRTGRVFEPIVKGKYEAFRLVGMDHFNAMFEDATTHSWWRQVNGEAVTGELKGETLPEVESFQYTIGKLFELFPDALVMQPDSISLAELKYDSLAKYERGKSTGSLTRRDSLSWQEKSWVVGIELNGVSKAYDWNYLNDKRIIQDMLGATPIVIVLSSDAQSFAAYKVSDTSRFILRNDSLVSETQTFDLFGRNGKNPEQKLERVPAYQEFWHSWRTFHPKTERYGFIEK